MRIAPDHPGGFLGRGSHVPMARGAACVAAAIALAGPFAPALPARAAPPAPGVAAVDTLWIGGAGRANRDLERWAKRADLADLVWLLRRPSRELGAAEPVLVRAALDRCDPGRGALRARLAARLAPDARDKRPRNSGATSGAATAAPARPAASVYSVGALFPDTGDYADYSRSVFDGVVAGIASVPPAGGRSLRLAWRSTGEDDPGRVAQAIERASEEDGVLVGGLLSVPTQALATGARLLGVPLVSPTATDEAIGTIGRGIFQIGPSGWRRGERLAGVVLDRPGLRVGTLLADESSRNPFAMGFVAAAESLGASVESQAVFRPGTSFRDELKVLTAKKVDVLLWDGEPRDAEALLREMARQKVSVRLCGGEGLAPDRLHAESRLLLDGVRYVAEDWKLPPRERAALDSTLRHHGAGPISPLHVRGWIAGRMIAQSVASGTLCPEELRDALQRRCGPPPWLEVHRFLDPGREGATLPIFVVQRGQAVELPDRGAQ